MSYALENALFQWEEGERRVRGSEPPERVRLERAAARVLEGLRRRLGSEFTIQELSDMYGSEPDWTHDAVPAVAVDAAFARYAREASDFGGGQRRQPF
ncbi:MAG TPA: hypothetical protein VF712_01930 [Thermoleophilaceae bacterium]